MDIRNYFKKPPPSTQKADTPAAPMTLSEPEKRKSEASPVTNQNLNQSKRPKIIDDEDDMIVNIPPIVMPKPESHKKESDSDGTEKLSDAEPPAAKPKSPKKQKKSPKKSKKNSEPLKVDPNSPASTLAGITIVLTGVFNSIKRDKLEDMLKYYGAKVTGSVSKKTTFLGIGSILEDGREVNTSKKYITAQSLGTQIYTETELEDYMRKMLKNPSFTFNSFDSTSLQKLAKSVTSSVAPQTQTVSNKTDNDANQLWTEKYTPNSIDKIIGHGAVLEKLIEWLKDWNDVVIHGHTKDTKSLFKRGMNFADLPKINARAVLISGPPGIGKTSGVRVVARQMGFEVLETNASDQRNKKSVEALLNDAISNESILHFLHHTNDSALSKKSVIIMDEIDGMSGSDRGGIAALINTIKCTKVPIICICNDRQSQKLKSIANYCYDLKFTRIQKQSLIKPMIEIAIKEGMQVESNAMETLIESTNGDIRQILNVMQMWKVQNKSISYLDMKQTYNNK